MALGMSLLLQQCVTSSLVVSLVCLSVAIDLNLSSPRIRTSEDSYHFLIKRFYITSVLHSVKYVVGD